MVFFVFDWLNGFHQLCSRKKHKTTMTTIKQISLVITLSLFSYSLFAQGWIRTYGSELDDQARDVIQIPDGGYVLTGTSNEDVFLVKTDQDGNVLWSNIYDNGSEEAGYFLTKSANGGYYILASYLGSRHLRKFY